MTAVGQLVGHGAANRMDQSVVELAALAALVVEGPTHGCGEALRDNGLDDAGIGHQPGPVGLAIAGDLFGIEAVEGFAEGVALPQDGDPRQPRLEAIQHQLFP